MDATTKWVHENQLGKRQSLVILTNIELEEKLAQRSSSSSRNVASLFDGILGSVFRYLRLTRFYALDESKIQAWCIPVSSTPSVDLDKSTNSVQNSKIKMVWVFCQIITRATRKVIRDARYAIMTPMQHGLSCNGAHPSFVQRGDGHKLALRTRQISLSRCWKPE